MTTIEIFTSPVCPHCPAAKETLKKFAVKNNLTFKEYSTYSKEGQKKVQQYNIMRVPTIIIKGNKETIGVVAQPTEEKLADALSVAEGTKELKPHTSVFEDLANKIKQAFKGE